MDDPNDRLRVPPSSSALIALASLTPPSPILSPCQLQATFTSGDIPILLDFIAETCEDTANEGAGTTSHGLGILSSSSINTFDTVGTFGPIRQFTGHLDSASTLSTFPQHDICTPSPSPVDNDTDPALIFTSPYSTPSDDMPGPKEKLAPENARSITSQIIKQVHYEASPASLHYDTCGERIPNSTTSTSQPSTNPYTLQELLSSSQLSESLSSSPRLRHTPNLSDSASRQTFVDTYTRQMAVAATLATLEAASYGSAPSSPQAIRFKLKSPRHNEVDLTSRFQLPKYKLPNHLDWLRDTIVELLIDQEGFRSVHARFKFSGYSSSNQATRVIDQPSDSRDDDKVQFRPITRQAFYFHYAPFDGLPVLRRITTNGEESRDYISRQASLGLKSNGVYTVRGSEVSFSPTPHEQEPKTHHGPDSANLSWRFDYLVDDRYDIHSSAGKRFDEGEKVLTPLTFSCSPLLLHPQQGKRVKLMHIVKKSVATKLIAEKMEPPTLRSAKCSSRLASPVLPIVTCQPPTKTHVWSIHRRAKSHAPHQEIVQQQLVNISNQELPAMTNASTILQGSPKKAPNVSPIRRRRASSAGEWSRPADTAPLPLLPNASPVQHPSKHIVPRAHLMRLLDVESEKTVPIRVIPTQLEASDFQPLAPSPRLRQGRMKPGAVVML